MVAAGVPKAVTREIVSHETFPPRQIGWCEVLRIHRHAIPKLEFRPIPEITRISRVHEGSSMLIRESAEISRIHVISGPGPRFFVLRPRRP